MNIVFVALLSIAIGVICDFLPRPLRAGLFTFSVFWALVMALGLLE